MPERLMGTDCKFVDNVYAGSNPARPKNLGLREYELNLFFLWKKKDVLSIEIKDKEKRGN